MKISDIEKHSGISAHTLRYYEKVGLFIASQRTKNNYRIYSKDDLATIKFIKRCKECGFSLAETSTLLAIKHNKNQHVCEEAKSITSKKIDELGLQISKLKRMQTTMRELEQLCCGGEVNAEFCNIISTLEETS